MQNYALMYREGLNFVVQIHGLIQYFLKIKTRSSAWNN